MARHKNESPSPSQQRYIDALAHGETQLAAYVAAGYNGDRSAASKLAKKYAAEVAAAREKLGLPPKVEAEPEVIDDEVIRGLVEENRRLYEASMAAQNWGAARKSLSALEKLLKRGKPKAKETAPTSKPVRANMFSHLSMDEITRMVLGDEEYEEIGAKYAAAEEGRQRWLRGENQSLEHLRLLPRDQQLETQVVGDEEPATSRAELKSSASHAALSAGEIVKRL